MAASLGRLITFTWGGSALGGVKEKSVSFNGEVVDITSDDDAGWRKNLDVYGLRSIDISLSGVTKNYATLKSDYLGTIEKAVLLTYPDGSTLAGTFTLESLSETGNVKDAIAYDVKLQSTGAVTYTPAP